MRPASVRLWRAVRGNINQDDKAVLIDGMGFRACRPDSARLPG